MNLELLNANRAFTVTPHDSTNITTMCHCLYVGTAGNVAVVLPNDDVVNFINVPSGFYLNVQCKRVNSTNTTASNIVGLAHI